MRDGIDYEYTIVFDINMKHQAVASKDRTNLFTGKSEFTITPTTGRLILDWCNDGVTLEMIKGEISKAETLEQLTSVYQQYPEWNQQLIADFSKRKACLVRKSVDRQIQHFLVKCVKKTKITGRISDFGNQCLAQQRKKFQSD